MTDERLARLGAHVAARQDALHRAEPDEATRRFVAEYTARRARHAAGTGSRRPRWSHWPRRHWPHLLLAALATVALFVLIEANFGAAPLSFTVGGQAGVLDSWQTAPDTAPLPIRFSDGTRIELEPEARARVVAVGPLGAELVVDSGLLHVDVVPVRAKSSGRSPWLVTLGPFSVEVKGTRFDVAWQPGDDAFSLDLFEGSVQIGGCEPGQSHTLVAGQSVRASCGKRSWTVTPLATTGERAATARSVAAERQGSRREPPAVASEDVVSPAADAGAAPRVEPHAPGAQREGEPRALGRAHDGVPREGSWRQLARRGRYAAAYAAALDEGFERICERAGGSDLVLLADTARLSGDAARARHAYSSVRRRFAGSVAAARAAFALGRLLVDTDPDAGARWFELYLREQPTGPLAASAADRLFELAAASGEPKRLRSVAENYLMTQPHGAHTGDARRILDAVPTP